MGKSFVARGPTIRDDIFSHLGKHADKFKGWFLPHTQILLAAGMNACRLGLETNVGLTVFISWRRLVDSASDHCCRYC